MRWIKNAIQEQPVRWCRWRDPPVISCVEEIRERFSRATPSGNIYHRPDEEPHHVVQESVRLDGEAQPGAFAPPLGHTHRAVMGICCWRRPAYSESEELMLTRQQDRDVIEGRAVVQSPRNAPLIPAPEWRGGLVVRPQMVSVAPRCGAEARVELIGSVVRLSDPDVWWQQRVERSAKFGGVPRLRHSHVRSLSPRVNPSVRPSRPY